MPPIGLVPQSQGRLADCVARAPPAGPSPLEVIAAEPAGDIHRLAYEIEAFDHARFHRPGGKPRGIDAACGHFRSEEHTSELQSLMRNSYAVFCLKKKKHNTYKPPHILKPQQTTHDILI